jgi:hypothetical protein
MEKCEKLLRNDFEVMKLVSKVDEAYNMLKFLKDKEMKMLLKLNKCRVVISSSSSSDSSDEGNLTVSSSSD